jgi:hypothetical protein
MPVSNSCTLGRLGNLPPAALCAKHVIVWCDSAHAHASSSEQRTQIFQTQSTLLRPVDQVLKGLGAQASGVPSSQ